MMPREKQEGYPDTYAVQPVNIVVRNDDDWSGQQHDFTVLIDVEMFLKTEDVGGLEEKRSAIQLEETIERWAIDDLEKVHDELQILVT